MYIYMYVYIYVYVYIYIFTYNQLIQSAKFELLLLLSTYILPLQNHH